MSTRPVAVGAQLFDARGCLSEAGLAELRSAAPGQAAPALAAHLAGCVRCQERALAVDAPRRASGARPRPVMPSLGKALFLGAVVLAAVLAALVTLRQLITR